MNNELPMQLDLSALYAGGSLCFLFGTLVNRFMR